MKRDSRQKKQSFSEKKTTLATFLLMFQMMQQHCGKFICTTLYFNRASKEQRKHVQIYHVLWDGNVFPLHVFKEDSSLGASLSLAPVSLSWQRMGELSLGAAAAALSVTQ